MVSLVDRLKQPAMRAWGQDRGSDSSFWFPAEQRLRQVTDVNGAELLIECLKQGSVFHCSLHFWRHTENIFVLPVGKDLLFYHSSVHLPFFS